MRGAGAGEPLGIVDRVGVGGIEADQLAPEPTITKERALPILVNLLAVRRKKLSTFSTPQEEAARACLARSSSSTTMDFAY